MELLAWTTRSGRLDPGKLSAPHRSHATGELHPQQLVSLADVGHVLAQAFPQQYIVMVDLPEERLLVFRQIAVVEGGLARRRR